MNSDCKKCTLRCKVHFPKKKVPYSEINCPRDQANAYKICWDKRMPRLAEFNQILVGMGKEPIEWR